MDMPLPRPARIVRMLAGAVLTALVLSGFTIPTASAGAAVPR
jgi:hypothetical protein